MLEFHKKNQQNPDKTEPEKRIKDFQEIYRQFDQNTSVEQSSRCSQCGVPFCQIHCPLNNNIPDWLRYIAEGRLKEAYEISSSTNAFPEVCGRVCPQDRLCEGNCVVEQAGFGAITIGNLEKYLTEVAWEKGWIQKINSSSPNNQKIAIIGSGPAGMAAASYLVKQGYQVDIFEKNDRAGGLMIYGIPNFKLDKSVVERRTEWLSESGVKFHLKKEVGKHISFQELEKDYDAILVATGVYKARQLDIETKNIENSLPALDFLIESNRVGLGDVPSPTKFFAAHDKHVVVIGGGDTAMDCVRTAVRQKAKSVKCIYRRDRENMPGSAREVANAIEEGVEFVWLASPKQFIGNSEVKEVEINKIKLGLPDSSGRRSPEIEPNSEYKIKADMVIKSLGFDPEDLPNLFNAKELNVSRWGTIKVNLDTMQTNLEGVFAAGDIVRGASLVVWAIKDGRDVALQIHKYLKENKNKSKAA